MIISGGRRFDFVRFFFIFLVWIIGAWFIIHNVNLADREGFALFNGTSYTRAQKAGITNGMDIDPPKADKESMPKMNIEK
ncbi:MAG: hypothetical protein V1655_00585 [bacterium]